MKGIGNVAAVSVQGAGQSNWISAVNKWGAQWEVNTMPGNGPYNLYIVLADHTRVRREHGDQPVLTVARIHGWTVTHGVRVVLT